MIDTQSTSFASMILMFSGVVTLVLTIFFMCDGLEKNHIMNRYSKALPIFLMALVMILIGYGGYLMGTVR